MFISSKNESILSIYKRANQVECNKKCNTKTRINKQKRQKREKIVNNVAFTKS